MFIINNIQKTPWVDFSIENVQSNQPLKYSVLLKKLFNANIDTVMSDMDSHNLRTNNIFIDMSHEDIEEVFATNKDQIFKYVFENGIVNNMDKLFNREISNIFFMIQDPTPLISYILENKQQYNMQLLSQLLTRYSYNQEKKLNQKILHQDDLLWYIDLFSRIHYDAMVDFTYLIQLIHYTNINDYDTIIDKIIDCIPFDLDLLITQNFINSFWDFPDQYKQKLANILFEKEHFSMLFTIYQSLWIDLKKLLLSMECNNVSYWEYFQKMSVNQEKIVKNDVYNFWQFMYYIKEFDYNWADFWQFSCEIKKSIEWLLRFTTIDISDDFLQKIRNMKERFIVLQNINNEINEETKYDINKTIADLIYRTDLKFHNNEDQVKHEKHTAAYSDRWLRLKKQKLSGKDISLIR